MDARVAALLTGNLLCTIGMLMFTGMANELSDDLRLTPAQLGPVLAVAPLVLAVGSPVLATYAGRFSRRALLVGATVIGAASHLLAAVSGSMALLLIARAITGLSTGVFAPQATATAMSLVPATQRGRVVSYLFLGFAMAHTIGLPLSTWLSAAVGWRPTVAGTGVLMLAIAAWLQRVIPGATPATPLERGAWGQLLRHPVMLGIFAVTTLQVGAQFVLYSLVAPYARDVLGASPALIGILFAALGVGGLFGSGLASRIADRIGPVQTTAWAIGAMLVAMLAWPLGGHTFLIPVLAMAIWGAGSFPAGSGQQVRLAGLDMRLAPVSLALNTSATYGGSALGSLIGSGLFATFGYASLSWGAAVMFAIALLLHWASTLPAFNRARP